MSKQETIDAVRILVQTGQIEPINAYARLEHILSAGQIDALLREWTRQQAHAVVGSS